MIGEIAVLNVGTGDTKLTFDKNNPAETIRASRIVEDMLRRGYALLIEVKKGKEVEYRRVKRFDPKTNEYIIADFDSAKAEAGAHEKAEREGPAAGTGETGEAARELAAPAGKTKTRQRRIAASSTRGVAVAPTAGG